MGITQLHGCKGYERCRAESRTRKADVTTRLEACLKERILIIDGAMGTHDPGLQTRWRRTIGASGLPTGIPTSGQQRPAGVEPSRRHSRDHDQYCAAGADILETNTFNATRIAMADYEMEALSAEINREAARLARAVADEWTAKDPQTALCGRVLGPTVPPPSRRT